MTAAEAALATEVLLAATARRRRGEVVTLPLPR